MSEELKKVDEMVALSDEDLDGVAGGYETSFWNSLTDEERIKQYKKSKAYRYLEEYCAMDDPNATVLQQKGKPNMKYNKPGFVKVNVMTNQAFTTYCEPGVDNNDVNFGGQWTSDACKEVVVIAGMVYSNCFIHRNQPGT